MDVTIIWSKFLEQIKEELNSLSYDTWFADTELYKLDQGKAIIIVPMPIHKNHLIDKYADIIINKLQEITGTNYELKLLLKEELEEIKEEPREVPTITLTESNATTNVNVNNNLNKKYNFENFIVGNSNKFAHAAALSVAENPGKMYNPLFLYGNSDS